MGNYLSLNLRFNNVLPTVTLIEAIFDNSFFSPIAVGGIEAHNHGDHWFLSGYALEDFVSRFIERGTPKPASIHLAASPTASEKRYLTMIAGELSQRNSLSQQLSPFETEDSVTGITFTDLVALDLSVLQDLGQWISLFPNGVLYIYGSIQLSIQDSRKFPWHRAFRLLFSREEGLRSSRAPLMLVRVGKSVFTPDTIEVSLFSESDIWLEQTQALGGRVGQQEAAVNLRRFATLAQLIAQAGDRNFIGAKLQIDGQSFQREYERIETAFAGIWDPTQE